MERIIISSICIIHISISKSLSFMFPHEVPTHPHSGPIDDLYEGDNAEAKKEAKESAKGRDKLNGSHRDASFQLFHEENK